MQPSSLSAFNADELHAATTGLQVHHFCPTGRVPGQQTASSPAC